MKELRKSIKSWIDGKPGQEFSTGLYLKTVGYKFVTYINTWDETTVEKMDIDDFFDEYVPTN